MSVEKSVAVERLCVIRFNNDGDVALFEAPAGYVSSSHAGRLQDGDVDVRNDGAKGRADRVLYGQSRVTRTVPLLVLRRIENKTITFNRKSITDWSTGLSHKILTGN